MLNDACEQTEVDLRRMFTQEMRIDVQHNDFQVKKQRLRLTHVRLIPPQDVGHSLFFCAANRTVKTEALSKLLPNLEAALADSADSRRFFYVGCISGKILDATVNGERTRFNLPDSHPEGVLFPDEIALQDILDAAVGKAKDFLEPFTRPLNEAKKERIKTFVVTEAPQYRPLLKHKAEQIDSLRSNLTNEQLDVELHKIWQEWDLDLRVEYRKLLAVKDETATTQEDFRKRYER
jgi:hypothetical protein